MEQNWRLEAACAKSDPELFFPLRDDSEAAKRAIIYATDICKTCPVIEPCGNAGADEPHGIWGGMTETKRQELRVRAARNAAAVLRNSKNTLQNTQSDVEPA